MKRIRLRDTSPEVALRKELWSLGLRYRLTTKISLPGKPDIVFPSARIAIFVDGCFWHGCPVHGHIPKSRIEYWKPKIKRTKQRDVQNNAMLASMGWKVFRFWEHQLKDNLPHCAYIIKQAINSTTVT